MAMDTGEWVEGTVPGSLPYYPHHLHTVLPVGYYHPQTERGAQEPASRQYFPSDAWTAFTQQQQQQPLHQAPDTPQSHHHQTFMSPSVSSCGDTASPHGSPWSTPDNDTDLDVYSYHGSPLSPPETYNLPPVSPSPWSSPAQLPFRTAEDQQSPGFQQARMCSPVSNVGSPHMAQALYPHHHTSHPFGEPAHSPPMGMPPATSVPARFMPPSPEGTSEVEGPLDEDEPPGHEPYSKQIGRALMSLPGRAGNVQQIYDWFEANTNRSVREGWKNSVRHNLSLNGAFDQGPSLAPEGEDAPPERGEPKKGNDSNKKGNDWMLLVDSIADIQSTAKFRAAKNKGKQPAASAARPTGVTKRSPSPRAGGGGRTQSGRRGGCATSRMKQEKQSRSAAAAAALQSQWVSVPGPSAPPAYLPEAGAPLTPAHTPEQQQQPALVGASMLDEAYRVDLSGYELADVVGVWSGAGGAFGGMHEQLQWHNPGTPGDA